MISYFIEFAILHVLFYLVYRIMLSKETQLGFRRLFLVGSTLLSLCIPAVEIPAPSALPVVDIGATILPAFEIDPQVSGDAPYTRYEALFFAVSMIFLLRYFYGIIRVVLFKKRGKQNTIDGIRVWDIPDLRTSFTFINWIFIDTAHFENPRDIVQHELGHAKKLHTLDVLFFHLLTIPFWWLPSLWLMIRDLKEVHEYEADEYALQTCNETYTKTLVHCTLKAHGMNLASSFDDAPILNRLNFMKKMKKKISIWKVVSITTLVAISAAMFACADELESEIKRIADESNQQIDYSADVKSALAELKQKNPNTEYVVVETSLDNQASIEKLSSYDPGQIAKIFVTKNDDEKRIVMIVSQDSDLFNKTVEVQYVDPANEVFTIIEKPATYPGGLDAFKQYLAENLKYPEEALKNKKEGRVFVQFIVEPDGSLSDVQVVKGIGGACDKEAVRVLMNSPKWIPGEQSGQKVRQKLVQSIQFTLPE